MDEEVTISKYIKAASAPSQDYFLSATSSAIYNLQLQEVGLSCHLVVGLLLIAIYMSSFQQFYAIVVKITNDPKLVEWINTDLPGSYWEISEKLFPGIFWGGNIPLFQSFCFEFQRDIC